MADEIVHDLNGMNKSSLLVTWELNVEMQVISQLSCGQLLIGKGLLHIYMWTLTISLHTQS